MRRFFVMLPAALAGAGHALAQTSGALAFTHVTVVDVPAGSRLADMTVIVQGNRITSVGDGAHVTIPPGARLIDARGKYLIPGLWDMHVHAVWRRNAPTFMPLFVVNGVTGVREMFGTIPLVQEARAGRGAAVVPRMVGSGHIMDGADPFWPRSVAVSTAAAARRAVDSLRSAGADFIKVYGLLPREAYFAIAERATQLGIPFGGHVPESVTAEEASHAGQRSIEHLSGVLRGCSTRERTLMRQTEQAIQQRNRGVLLAALRNAAMEALSSYDEATCFSLAARFARNGTWHVPTLTVRRGRAFLCDSTLTADPRLRFVLREIRDGWQPGRGGRNGVDATELADRKRVYAKELALVALLHRAGVPLVAGTDTPNPYSLPGFGLHDELALLVEAGLTPLDALRAATSDAAQLLGVLDSLGTVAQGKLADLVLLDADPLADIGNTRRISAVVLNGRLIDDAARQRLLARVEEMANRP